MKNKGFTLVELLGVIVLLGILSIVIIPKVGDSLENSKETALLTQEEQIKKAAYDFLVEHTELLDESDTITLKIGILKQGGYLPIKLINPKTRKPLSNESTITITKNENKYEMTLNLIDLENATENIDNNSPILVLNGNYIEYVEVNEEYIEQGAKAITSTGEEINEENISIQVLYNGEETTLTTTELKTYSVVYAVTDNGKTTSATRTVIVRDSTSPTIIIPKDTSIHISEIASFNNQKGVIIADNYDANPTLTINSTLANIPGNYVITYTVTDSSGNTATERRVVNVDANFANYYANLEYIESTGTQYIMTDIIPTNDMGIYAKIKSSNVSSDLIFFGSKGSTDNRFWIGNSSSKIYYGWNTAIPQASQRPIITTNDIFEIKMNYLNNRKTVFNNTDVQDNLATLTDNTFPIAIFAGNKQGSITAKSSIKLYNLKITKGDELKYNFIPCIRNRDNIAGLYDLINNKFYISNGTEDLIKGE